MKFKLHLSYGEESNFYKNVLFLHSTFEFYNALTIKYSAMITDIVPAIHF